MCILAVGLYLNTYIDSKRRRNAWVSISKSRKTDSRTLLLFSFDEFDVCRERMCEPPVKSLTMLEKSVDSEITGVVIYA